MTGLNPHENIVGYSIGELMFLINAGNIQHLCLVMSMSISFMSSNQFGINCLHSVILFSYFSEYFKLIFSFDGEVSITNLNMMIYYNYICNPCA